MQNYNFMIKPASTQCNYRCSYCVYADKDEAREARLTKIMSEETIANLIRIAVDAPDAEEITFAFQGGEPTLAGIDYFYFFYTLANMLKKPNQNIFYTMQTNGSTLNDEWGAFLKECNFLVGISLDGFEAAHDNHRISKENTGTFEATMRAIKLLQHYEVDFNVVSVITKTTANLATEIYEFYRKNNFEYIQFLPCLAQNEDVEDPFALTPRLFATFYNELFDQWCIDYSAGIYRSVTLIDSAIALFSGIVPQQCGILGFCSPQFVVDADGTVSPCDFHVQHESTIGNVNDHSVLQLLKNEMMQKFLSEPKQISKLCETCPFIKMCNGNCKRQNRSYFDDTLCGYQEFLKYAYPNIRVIIDHINENKTNPIAEMQS